MTRLNCFEVEQDLWRYVDRELPASGVAAVSDHLKRCDACQKLYHDRAREANVCRGVLSASALGADSSDRIVKAMEREGLFRQSPPAVAATGRRGDDGVVVRALVPFRGRLAFAAVFLLAATVGLTVWLSNSAAPAFLGEFEADGLVRRSDGAGSAFVLFSSGDCRAGNSFVVPEEVKLTVSLGALGGSAGSSLVVTGPAELTLDAASTPRNFSAVMEVGRLTARVAPLRTGDAFAIETAEARVTVVGTEFVVDATVEGETRLDVSHGIVDFRALDAPVGQTGRLVTAATGTALLRRGARVPDLSPPAPSAVAGDRPGAGESSESPGAAAASDPGASPDLDSGVSRVEIDSSVPSEPPERGTGSTGGPTLDRPSESDDLDQVVNPHRGEKDEARDDE